jgi:hypothetical protein
VPSSVAGDIELPVRRTNDLPVVEPPPVLPAAARHLPPLTLRFVNDGGGATARPMEYTFVRGRGRGHLRTNDGRGEWLFTQNPVAPARVSGAYADHTARTITEYSETDLRLALNLRGWLDVLTCRFRADALSAMQPSGRRLIVNDVGFDQHVRTDDGDGIREAWWNADLLVAAKVVLRHGAVRVQSRLQSVTRGIDDALLAPLSERFPGYAVRGYSDDWKTHP